MLGYLVCPSCYGLPKWQCWVDNHLTNPAEGCYCGVKIAETDLNSYILIQHANPKRIYILIWSWTHDVETKFADSCF
jgi:hypothetical protein